MTARGSLSIATSSDHDRDHRPSHTCVAIGFEAQPVPLVWRWKRSVTRENARRVARILDVAAKGALLIMLGLALIYPDMGHMEDKASGLRAVTYPLLAFALPAVWWLCRRDRASFPWGPDLMVTTTLFTDILGNRMDLFDSVEWFDDWVHVINPGLLTGAVLLLTVPSTSTLVAMLERALAFGMTTAVAWEVAEYAAFISRSTEKQSAYSDTLGDLILGAVGAVVAALIIHTCRAVRKRMRVPHARWANPEVSQAPNFPAHRCLSRCFAHEPSSGGLSADRPDWWS